MNKYKYLSTLIFDQPQLCTPGYAETVLTILSDKFNLDNSEMAIQDHEKESEGPNIQGDGTLVIPILGSMVNRAGWLDAMSGIQSYGTIQKEIEEGLDNPNVKSILLEMDSPGGTVAGAFDLRDYIMSVRGQKPIVALSTDTMASAAYLIGSACDNVYTTQTGQVGSIGVVAMHMDQSKANEEKGVKPTFIYAGDYKVAGNPHEPLEGEALTYLQESVNDSYEMFVNAVAESRGLEASKVKGTQARMYRGEKAIEMGLADKVMTYAQTLEELASSAPRVQNPMSINQRGLKMDKDELETMQAELASLKEQNEALRGAVISEGYKITANGIEKAQEAPETEYMEVGGESVDVATIPGPVLKQLKADAEKQADADLTARASAELPNFAEGVAKDLLKADLSEETLKALKAADSVFSKSMEEVGDSEAEGNLEDPKTAMDAKIAEIAKEKNMSPEKAYAEFAKTSEGKKMIQSAYYDKEA